MITCIIFYSINQLARPESISTSIEAKLHFINCVISFDMPLRNLVCAVLGVMNTDCFVVDVPLLVFHGKHNLSPLKHTMLSVVNMRVDFDVVTAPECCRVNLILVNRLEMSPRVFSILRKIIKVYTYNHILFKIPFSILKHGITVGELLIYALPGHPAIE